MAVIRDAALRSQDDYRPRLLAEAVCQHLRSKDYLSEILALNNFCWGHARYMQDPRTVELVQAPVEIIKQLQTGYVPQLDCDDFAGFECGLGLAVGREVRLATVAFADMFYKGQRQYSHVFAQMKEPRSNAWITCDPVAGVDTAKMLNRVKAVRFWPVA